MIMDILENLKTKIDFYMNEKFKSIVFRNLIYDILVETKYYYLEFLEVFSSQLFPECA